MPEYDYGDGKDREREYVDPSRDKRAGETERETYLRQSARSELDRARENNYTQDYSGTDSYSRGYDSGGYQGSSPYTNIAKLVQNIGIGLILFAVVSWSMGWFAETKIGAYGLREMFFIHGIYALLIGYAPWLVFGLALLFAVFLFFSGGVVPAIIIAVVSFFLTRLFVKS